MKTMHLNLNTHRLLKQYALDKDCTISQALDSMLDHRTAIVNFLWFANEKHGRSLVKDPESLTALLDEYFNA